jgi:1-deoxyxylulose-5-phosphate synthase
MQKRLLGTTDITVTRLGLGCVTFGREIDEAASFRILDQALERGITLLDTAEAYGAAESQEHRRKTLGIDDVREVSSESHSSEKIIGRWLQARRCRDRVVIQTKLSNNFTRQHVAEALDASLERLQTNYVDFYMFHSYDPKTPLEQALEAMTAAVESGKVRAIGCSNFSAAQMREALALSRSKGVAKLEMTQPPYSLVSREIETELLPLCRAERIGVGTYSPLAGGFLSGKYRPDHGGIPKGSRFDIKPNHADQYFSDRNFRTVERLRRVADEMSLPMTCVALAWVLRNPDVTSVLVGATSTAHLDNAVRALDVRLTAEQAQMLEASEDP